MTTTDLPDGDVGKYPDGATIHMAAHEDSEGYYFRTPTGGIMQVPALSQAQARKMAADEYRGFGPEDFEPVDGFDAEPRPYPDPVDSDREVNEYDLWCLRAGTRKGSRAGLQSSHPRKNPTNHTIALLLDHWDDPTEVPLHDRDALQQADGIGPHRAGQVVGAAVARNLIEVAVRTDDA